MSARSFLTIMILSCITPAIAQKTLVLQKQTRLPQTNREITESFLNEKTGEYVRSFQSNAKKEKIINGRFSGMDIVTFQQGLILSNGTEVLLKRNEQIIANKDGTILTGASDYTNETTDLKTYRLDQDNIRLTGRKQIQFIEGSYYLIGDQTVIITDESEGYGTSVEINSADFRVLNTYKPFPTGFSQCLFTGSDRKIIGVFENKDDGTKIAIFNAATGRLFNEGYVNLPHGLQTAHSFGDYLLIYAGGKVTCLDLTGNTRWTNSVVLPTLEIFDDGVGIVYLLTNKGVQSVDAKSGTIKWEKPLSSMSTRKGNANTRNLRLVSFQGNAEDDNIHLIVSETESMGELTTDLPKYNNYFVELNRNGDVTQRIFLTDRSKELKLKKSGKGIEIIQDQNILRYEK